MTTTELAVLFLLLPAFGLATSIAVTAFDPHNPLRWLHIALAALILAATTAYLAAVTS